MKSNQNMKRREKIADSDYGKWRDLLNLPTTALQDAECLLLEAEGLRFMVDFGYENAGQIYDARITTNREHLKT